MKRFVLAALFVLSLVSAAFAEQPVISSSSGIVANATAAASVAASVQNYTYLTGIEVTASGATAAACVPLTITGILGGTATYVFCTPAGVSVMAQSLAFQFYPRLRSLNPNTAITVSLQALGAGNANASVNVHGYAE